MATDLSICQMAVNNLGVQVTLSSITSPTSKEEKACYTYYATARRKLLSMADWPFARKYAVLTEDTAFDDPEFQYVYALPSDYVRALRVEPTRTTVAVAKTPFRIGLKSNDSALRLFCDIEAVTSTAPVLEYTADIGTGSPTVYAGLYPEVFCDALAWEMAARIALPLRVDPKVAMLAKRMAQMTYEEAFSILMSASHEDDYPDAEHILARS